jgi:hypothetical protein
MTEDEREKQRIRLGMQKQKGTSARIYTPCTQRPREQKQGEGVYSRHPHGETGNHAFVVERLQYKPTDRRVVDSGIFVVLQVRQFMLPDVHHSLGCFARL